MKKYWDKNRHCVILRGINYVVRPFYFVRQKAVERYTCTCIYKDHTCETFHFKWETPFCCPMYKYAA